MTTLVHDKDGTKIVEVFGEGIFIRSPQDAVQLMMDIAAEGCRKIILHQENITPEFFDLKSRLAGEILQKFANYSIQLAIVGNFVDVKSESLRAFIIESNRGRHVFFANEFAVAYSLLISRNI
ncbi:MAG TPA: DUF4180 domain-containing protein [Bdellovibrio sp.]|uniref:DUF4180 domain-containing protein n=1 Tax=Bdellovibrio sp. TaxID=28201 RepID=UPI002F13597E